MRIEKLGEKIKYNDNSFTKKVIFNEDKILSFVLNFKPGQSVPPHLHEQSDIIVHVIRGAGDMTVDRVLHHVEEGDVVHCTGKEEFGLANTTEKELSCFVVLAPNPSANYSKEI